MADRFDEATRLKNLLGRREAIIKREQDPRSPNYCILERIEIERDLLEAAPWLLEAAACFQPGDVRCLKAIMGIMRAATGPETDSEELDCLRRLQEAASLLEAEDVNP